LKSFLDSVFSLFPGNSSEQSSEINLQATSNRDERYQIAFFKKRSFHSCSFKSTNSAKLHS
jgi:hypothetical protein